MTHGRSLIQFHFFFFNDTATTEIYTLSLHDALPILSSTRLAAGAGARRAPLTATSTSSCQKAMPVLACSTGRSEEHTSELQSRQYLVCRLLLEKKKKIKKHVL